MKAKCPKGHDAYLVTLETRYEAFEWDERGEPEPTETVDYGSYEGDDFEPYITCLTCCQQWSVEQFPREGTRPFGCPKCGSQKVEAEVPNASQVRYYSDEGEVVDADTDFGDRLVNERCADCEEPFDPSKWRQQ